VVDDPGAARVSSVGEQGLDRGAVRVDSTERRSSVSSSDSSDCAHGVEGSPLLLLLLQLWQSGRVEQERGGGGEAATGLFFCASPSAVCLCGWSSCGEGLMNGASSVQQWRWRGGDPSM
jgi:hypothetical protein